MSNTIETAGISNLQKNWFSEELTEYATGYSCESIKNILDFIAPEVQSPKKFEFLRTNKNTILADDVTLNEDLRSLHTDFKRLPWLGSLTLGSCNSYGLTMFVESDEKTLLEHAVRILKRRLLLNDTLRALNLIEKATSNITSKTWVKDTGTNPISDLNSLIKSVGDNSSFPANKLLFGFNAWTLRGEYYDEDSANYLISPEDLSLKLGVDKILVGNERIEKRTSKGTEREQIVPKNKVFAFYSQDDASRTDDSFMKRFVSGDFNVYKKETAAGVDVTVWIHSTLMMINKSAMQAYSIA